MSELPSGWVVAALGDICAQPEQRVPRDDEDFIYIDIASVDRTLKTVSEPQQLLGAEAPSRARKIVDKGDVLVSMTRPNLNAVALIHEQHSNCIASTGFDVLKPIEVEPRWIFAAVRSAQFVEAMCAKVQGALYPAVKGADIRAYEIPVPPLAEQTRIAQKLNELLTQVDTLKARIDAIPALLKRFRQSVLAAAVSGRLTDEWRTAQLGSVTNVLLPGRSQNTVPPNWCTLIHDEIADVIDPHPSHRTPSEDPDGVPYIGIGDVDELGKIDFESARKVSKSVLDEHRARYSINDGDFIFGKIGTIGSATRIPASGEYTISANVILVKPISGKVDPTYHWLFWRSPLALEISAKGSKATSQAAFGIKKMRKAELNYPPMDEQSEIVRRVEQLFAFADLLEDKITSTKTRIDHLTQSILAKTFRGELVPQDPNDESASVLLERIKAQRGVTPKAKRGRKVSA